MRDWEAQHGKHEMSYGLACDRCVTEPIPNACLLMARVRQAITQLFAAGRHREATEILVEHIMLISPGANKEKMLKGRKLEWDPFGSRRCELVNWNLSNCQISQLPESFCALVCYGDLKLNGNQLRSLPEGFGDITVGGGLFLSRNQLTEYPSSFPNAAGGVER
jgi:hypothetical protein